MENEQQIQLQKWLNLLKNSTIAQEEEGRLRNDSVFLLAKMKPIAKRAFRNAETTSKEEIPMKKTVALILTLAMVFAMALSTGAVAEGEKIKLTFSHWGSTADAAVYQARAELFEAQHENIEVEIVYIPEDYVTKITTAMASDTAPDVMVIAEEANAFAYHGQLLPMNDYLEAAGVNLEERVGAAAAGAYTYDGNVYGLADRAGCSVCYYNKDLFDAAGIAYPNADWTRDDFLAAAKAIATDADVNDKVWGYVQEDWFPYWMSWVYGGNGCVVDAEGNIAVDSAENVASLTFMRDLVSVHGVTPSRAQMASIGTGATASSLFASGKAAMYCTGAWGIASFKDVENLNWDMAPLWDKATPAFGSAICINAKTAHPDEAFELANFMNSEEAQALIAENCEDVPSNLKVLNSDAFLKATWANRELNMGVFGESVAMTFAPPTLPEWNSWTGIWGELLDPIYDGEGDPAEILKEMQSQMQQVRDDL